jgi:hypothetical protein
MFYAHILIKKTPAHGDLPELSVVVLKIKKRLENIRSSLAEKFQGKT